ncbi:MAG: PolC-type DNA polymerase III [Eubacteriales bacterium]|nr:PolC-type DNA polymerase III [Eubacteriales bacterium]
MEKTLLQRFDKYNPNERFRKIMTDGIVTATRVSVESKSVLVDVRFPYTVPKKDLLYPLEAAIKKAYELKSVMIFPKYEAELFDEEYIQQIMVEACRRKLITDLFLRRSKQRLIDGKLIIETLYGDGGIALMEETGTEKSISAIISGEFGINVPVEIRASSERDEQFEKLLIFDNETKLTKYYEKTAQRIETEKKCATSTGTYREISTDGEGHILAGFAVFDISSPEQISGKNVESGDFTPIGACTEPKKNIALIGEIACMAVNETRRGNKTVTFSLTDFEGSVTVKCVGKKAAEYAGLSNGTSVIMEGELKYDDYDRDRELTFYPSSAMKVKRVLRQDKHNGQKRVELHLHTNMSMMDATMAPSLAVATAHRWGHAAVAITDHGNVQGFPDAMKMSEKLGMKVIYGMEGYLVDDAAKAIFGEDDTGFDDEFVVFDIETTGLSAMTCKITEIGAVLVQKGEVLKVFSTFVNPEGHIPEEITELTGITDDMVSDAPSQGDAVKAFIEFVGKRTVVAHNANFDMGFIRRAAENAGIHFDPPYLDTLSMSRFLNPELKNHKLDTLVDFYRLGDFNHHRACDDAEVTAKIFCKMTEKLAGESIYTVRQMSESMAEKTDPHRLRPYHIILLVKNPTGLKNLYKIVSNGYLKYYYRHPRIPKTELVDLREGLVIGSACIEGELASAVLDGKAWDELLSIAEFYDYLEIQPICNNEFLIGSKGLTHDALIEINKTIVRIGETLGKPVVATCDAHYLEDYDGISRSVLLRGMGMKDGDRDSHLFFRTTDEMLKEFSYLGEEKAREVVIENTNKIADLIGTDIRPFPNGTYTPKMEGAEEELMDICYTTAKSIYGDPLPDIVEKRLKKELDSIISHGFAVLYMIARKLVKYSESQGYLVGSRGSVGSSFVASMAGISEVNPLPPHYVCPKCRHSDFSNEEGAGSGFDLPPKNCPVCGARYNSDGHDIPFETFLGFFGDKSPDIDLNFSGEVQGKVHKYTEELFGKENVFRAGTIGTLAEKTAYGFVAGYFDDKGIKVNKAEINRIVSKCVGVKRTTGQHPGGIVVVPKEYEIYDFCPVQHPADDASSDIITTHFTFNDMHDLLLKLDELGHDIPTKYKYIEMFTHTSVLDVPVGDPEVYKLFNSTEPLGIKPEDIMGIQVGTLGIPENGTDFVIPVLVEAKPKTFADLLQIMGLTHGTDVWSGNAQVLIKEGICELKSVVGTRDSIMLRLIQYGLDNKDAFDIMEKVRKNKKGDPLPDWMIDKMHEHNVDEWYIESLKKIKYMFPKAHAAAYVLSAIRIAWYKVHMPLEFYCAYFSAAPDGFDGELAVKSKKTIEAVLKDLKEKGNEQSQKEAATYSAMQLALEFVARGFKFLPVDLYRSDARLFLPEDGAIRLPFSSLSGVGVAAAQNIVDAREAGGEFLSVEELKQRASVSKSVVEILEKNGVLKNLSETNQITFGFGDDDFRSSGASKQASSSKSDSAKKSAAKQEDFEETASQLTFF